MECDRSLASVNHLRTGTAAVRPRIFNGSFREGGWTGSTSSPDRPSSMPVGQNSPRRRRTSHIGAKPPSGRRHSYSVAGESQQLSVSHIRTRRHSIQNEARADAHAPPRPSPGRNMTDEQFKRAADQIAVAVAGTQNIACNNPGYRLTVSDISIPLGYGLGDLWPAQKEI